MVRNVLGRLQMRNGACVVMVLTNLPSLNAVLNDMGLELVKLLENGSHKEDGVLQSLLSKT